MQHHGSGDGHNGSNVALGDTIVMVSADACESDNLLEIGEVAREFGRGERLGIVRKKFLRHDSSVATHTFEAFLCLESLMRVEADLMFHKNVTGGMVNKDATSSIHLFKFGLAGGGEQTTTSAADEVVD